MASRVIDNIIALRIIYLLITPFDKTDAYKLGLIDSTGKRLKKAETSEEKDASTMLHRLVWNIKRLISLVPGGSSKIGTLTAAMLLVKEAIDNKWSEERLIEEYLTHEMQPSLEDESLVEDCLDQLSIFNEDAPANAAGPAVSTDTPTKKPKKILKRFEVVNAINGT